MQRYHVRLYRLVARHAAPSGLDVDDIVQTVWMTVWQRGGRLRANQRFAPWLFRVAINRCRSHSRRLSLWQRFIAFAPRGSELTTVPADHRLIQRDWLDQALSRLSRSDREILILRYDAAMESEQIAQTLQLSVDAVDQRLHRARNRLKTYLEPDA